MASFALASVVCVLLLYLPGAAGLLLAKKSASFSICFAPLVSIALFEIAAIAFALLGLEANGAFITITATLISLIAGCIIRKAAPGSNDFQFPLTAFGLIAAFALIFCLLVYFRPFGYTTIMTGYDACFHVNLIQAFIDSGYYSPFGCGLYSGSEFSPVSSSNSFYPAAWHLICAVVREATQIDPTVTINAVNCIFCGVCFTSGQIILVSRLLTISRIELLLLSLFPLLSIAFPWAQLIRGELFSQIASFSLLPLACALFDVAITQKGKDVAGTLCGLCALLTLATLQTNAVFSLSIFVFFDLLRHIKNGPKSRGKRRRILLLVLTSTVLWTAAFCSPFMSGVVSYEWESTNSILQALANVCTLSFSVNTCQLVLAAFAIGGLIWLLKSKKNVWLAGPFLFASIVYVIATSMEGLPKHFLGGFWYTDPMRLSAQASIFAFPLIVLGVLWGLRALCSLIKIKGKKTKIAQIAFCLLVVVGGSITSVRIPALFELPAPFECIWQAIDDYRNEEYEPILSKSELDLCKEASKLIEPGAVIINVPDDGSGFLYGLLDANVYYKRPFDLEYEKPESKILREGLNEISYNSAVQEAANSIGAKYLLLLDTDDNSGLFLTYNEDSRWRSFYSIDENTLGFKLLLSKDDCRLYKIVL